MFDKLKGVADKGKMIAQAMAIQRQLAGEEIVVEDKGIRVVMTGDQKIKEVFIDGESKADLADVLNRAMRQTQEVAAGKMKGLLGM